MSATNRVIAATYMHFLMYVWICIILTTNISLTNIGFILPRRRICHRSVICHVYDSLWIPIMIVPQLKSIICIVVDLKKAITQNKEISYVQLGNHIQLCYAISYLLTQYLRVCSFNILHRRSVEATEVISNETHKPISIVEIQKQSTTQCFLFQTSYVLYEILPDTFSFTRIRDKCK